MILRIGNDRLPTPGVKKSFSFFQTPGVGRRLSKKNISRTPRTELGFTLVEVLISVAILGFGLAIIIRSFSSAIIGLDSCQNYNKSLRFAQDKMNELTLTSYEKKGLLPEINSGEVKLGNRQFSWQTEISEISKPEYLSKDFVIVSVGLEWLERNIPKNSALVTYLPKKKEEQKK